MVLLHLNKQTMGEILNGLCKGKFKFLNTWIFSACQQKMHNANKQNIKQNIFKETWWTISARLFWKKKLNENIS